MNRTLLAAVAAVFVSAACSSVSQQSSGPSSASSLLSGTWRSVQSASPQDSCTNFTWTVTQFTGVTGSGTFSATCFGNIQVAGTASATLTTATTANWTVNAAATGPGLPAQCPITLTGTAVLEGEFIRIPYSGSWCLGPLSGTETVRR
jgi:hypothetical protein